MQRIPSWIRIRMRSGGRLAAVQDGLAAAALNTVCASAQCPNRAECFHRGTAAFLLLGDICTRRCRFCAVRHGAPEPPDPDEPRRVAALAAELGLRHVVVTSVTRDDLPDGGAAAFVEVIAGLKKLPGVTVEVLVPDFQGAAAPVAAVLAAGPDVFNHNLETVARLQPAIRPQADYRRSLRVLESAARVRPGPLVKSGLMAGLGETDGELFRAMRDLRAAGCAALTVGQYLAPSRKHAPVARYVAPERFEDYRAEALAMGFAAVASGPLVRSSYKAEAMLKP